MKTITKDNLFVMLRNLVDDDFQHGETYSGEPVSITLMDSNDNINNDINVSLLKNDDELQLVVRFVNTDVDDAHGWVEDLLTQLKLENCCEITDEGDYGENIITAIFVMDDFVENNGNKEIIDIGVNAGMSVNTNANVNVNDGENKDEISAAEDILKSVIDSSDININNENDENENDENDDINDDNEEKNDNIDNNEEKEEIDLSSDKNEINSSSDQLLIEQMKQHMSKINPNINMYSYLSEEKNKEEEEKNENKEEKEKEANNIIIASNEKIIITPNNNNDDDENNVLKNDVLKTDVSPQAQTQTQVNTVIKKPRKKANVTLTQAKQISIANNVLNSNNTTAGVSLKGYSNRVSTVAADGRVISAASQVKEMLDEITSSNTMTAALLVNLQDVILCKREMKLSYPLLMKVNPNLTYKEQASFAGKKRYGKRIVNFCGQDFYVTNHIFAGNVSRIRTYLENNNLIKTTANSLKVVPEIAKQQAIQNLINQKVTSSKPTVLTATQNMSNKVNTNV